MSDVQIQISDDQILRSDDQILRSDDQTLRSDGQISQTEVIWGIKKQEQEQEQQEQEQLYKDVEARQHSCSRLKTKWILKYLGFSRNFLLALLLEVTTGIFWRWRANFSQAMSIDCELANLQVAKATN